MPIAVVMLLEHADDRCASPPNSLSRAEKLLDDNNLVFSGFILSGPFYLPTSYCFPLAPFIKPLPLTPLTNFAISSSHLWPVSQTPPYAHAATRHPHQQRELET
jgi:hypothetical protein